LLVARSFANRANAGSLIRRWSIGITVVAALLTLVVFPRMAPRFASAALFEKCRPYLKPDMVLGSMDYHEPSVVWEFRQLIGSNLIAVNAEGAPEFLRTNQTCILIGTINALQPIEAGDASGYQRVEASGFNVAKGQAVTLQAIIK
jgi:hypothetical protein